MVFSDCVFNGWNTPNTYNKEYKPLPNASGVYLLVLREFLFKKHEIGMYMKQKILYVGSSQNLSNRCENHPVKEKILKDNKLLSGVSVACYFKECDNYKEEERRLIKLTQARYNKQWR
jgi:excinuclease UvrABC nuclease subunit